MATRARSLSAPVPPSTPPGNRTPARPAFCVPGTPSALAALPENELIPEIDDATTLVSLLHPAPKTAIAGNLLPSVTSDAIAEYDALGICAHWHSATQDVDFERKLLLRALLASQPPGAIVLPDGCSSLDEVDLAPLKVQDLLDALSQRRVCDLNSNQFRWDVKQPPPKLAWSGDEQHGVSSTNPPPWAGLSKRQLDVASYEALLLAVGREGDSNAAFDVRDAATVRCIAAQLGIGSRQHRRILSALRLPTVDAAGGGSSTAAARCGMQQRLMLLQAMTPADFATDNEFFEWQERQAALLGASLHAMLAQLAKLHE